MRRCSVLWCRVLLRRGVCLRSSVLLSRTWSRLCMVLRSRMLRLRCRFVLRLCELRARSGRCVLRLRCRFVLRLRELRARSGRCVLRLRCRFVLRLRELRARSRSCARRGSMRWNDVHVILIAQNLLPLLCERCRRSWSRPECVERLRGRRADVHGTCRVAKRRRIGCDRKYVADDRCVRVVS